MVQRTILKKNESYELELQVLQKKKEMMSLQVEEIQERMKSMSLKLRAMTKKEEESLSDKVHETKEEINELTLALEKIQEKNINLTLSIKKSGEEWRWEEPQQKSFSELKTLLTQAPILARPDPSKPFTLQTDASSFALGSVLTQTFDGEEHPIAYASRTSTKAERNYTVTDGGPLNTLSLITGQNIKTNS